MPLAPWLLPPDYLAAMREGAGLGLNIRAQSAREQESAAANALQQQSMFQQAQQAQAARAQAAQLAQQQAAVQLADQQTRRADTLGQLQMQQGFHNDTLQQQDVANQRADAAQALKTRSEALAEDRAAKMFDLQTATQNRLTDLGERKLTLEEQKAGKLSSTEQTRQVRLDAAKSAFKNSFGDMTPEDEANLTDSVVSNQYKRPTAQEARELRANVSMVSLTDNLSKQIDAFNAKYGNGQDVFSKDYAGVMKNAVNNAEKALNLSPVSAKDAEAYKIIQDFQGNFDARTASLGRSGVSKDNIERMKQEIGSIKSGNFANEIKNFEEMRARDLVNQVLRSKGSQMVDPLDAQVADRMNRKHGINPDVEIVRRGTAVPGAPAPSATPSVAVQSGPPAPKSKAEYEALPSGTVYTAPDGTVKRKK